MDFKKKQVAKILAAEQVLQEEKKAERKVYHKSEKMDWETPDWLFKMADERWGPFELDAAATEENKKCPLCLTFYGLEAPWDMKASRVWLNPPYGREIGKWIAKAYEESEKGCRVVCLIPARTDTQYWHDYVTKAAEIVFLKGRVKFKGAKNGAPFPSALVVFDLRFYKIWSETDLTTPKVTWEDWRED